MTQQHPLPALPQTLNATPPGGNIVTMADLLERIAGDDALTVSRRRNVASSIRRFCALLGVEPQHMPAAFWAFRERLEGFQPLACGVTVRRFQTIKSDVGFALKRIAAAQSRPRPALSDAWIALKAGTASPWYTLRISRLASYCSAQGITPAGVDDAVIAGYRVFVEGHTFKTEPQNHVRDVCRQWNRLAADKDLGLSPVRLPEGRATYAPDLADLAPGFRAEAEAWLHSLSADADLFDAQAPTRPLKASSIEAYRFKLRQLVGALREERYDPAKLLHLEDLVDLDRVRTIIGFFQKRGSRSAAIADGKIADGGILHVLRLIARRTRPDNDALHQRLKSAHGRTTPGPRTMGKRSQTALRQFDDPAAFDTLLALPPTIAAALDRQGTLARRQALDYQAAVALELLIMRPIRLKNLVGLRLDQHVLRDASTRTGSTITAGTRISIPADEVKNAVALDYLLPATSAAMLDRYIANALPLLSADPAGFLFPGAMSGQAKAGSNLGRQLRDLIARYTGLYVTAHLMRHIAAKLYLHIVPEGMETVRQLLAHTSADTTARSYVGLANAAALARYDDLVLTRRGQHAPAVSRPGTPR